MEAGEKELRQAFEEVTTRNVKTTVEYSTETRRLVRTLEEKVTSLDGLVRKQNETIEALRSQISSMQAIVYRGGTT